MLMVVFAHSIAVLPSYLCSNNITLLRDLSTNVSLIFLVIGGFLFSELIAHYTYQTYLFTKFKHVVLPYLFLSIPACLIYVLGLKSNHPWIDMNEFNNMWWGAKYFYLMATGAHLGPLWFIPMIILMYLSFPLFLAIIKRKQKQIGIILLLSLLIAAYNGRPVLNSSTLGAYIYFFPAYLLGIWLSINKVIYLKYNKYSLLQLSLVIFLCVCIYAIYDYHSSYDLFLKLIIAVLLISVFSYCLDKKITYLSFIADISFFIFFIHGYFAGAIRILLRNQIDVNGYIVLLSVFMLILSGSIASYFILRIPFKSSSYRRYFISCS